MYRLDKSFESQVTLVQITVTVKCLPNCLLPTLERYIISNMTVITLPRSGQFTGPRTVLIFWMSDLLSRKNDQYESVRRYVKTGRFLAETLEKLPIIDRRF